MQELCCRGYDAGAMLQGLCCTGYAARAMLQVLCCYYVGAMLQGLSCRGYAAGAMLQGPRCRAYAAGAMLQGLCCAQGGRRTRRQPRKSADHRSACRDLRAQLLCSSGFTDCTRCTICKYTTLYLDLSVYIDLSVCIFFFPRDCCQSGANLSVRTRAARARTRQTWALSLLGHRPSLSAKN